MRARTLLTVPDEIFRHMVTYFDDRRQFDLFQTCRQLKSILQHDNYIKARFYHVSWETLAIDHVLCREKEKSVEICRHILNEHEHTCRLPHTNCEFGQSGPWRWKRQHVESPDEVLCKVWEFGVRCKHWTNVDVFTALVIHFGNENDGQRLLNLASMWEDYEVTCDTIGLNALETAYVINKNFHRLHEHETLGRSLRKQMTPKRLASLRNTYGE